MLKLLLVSTLLCALVSQGCSIEAFDKSGQGNIPPIEDIPGTITVMGKLVVEPNIYSVGIEWPMNTSGDPGHEATAMVVYCVAGTKDCQTAQLLRIDYRGWNDRCCDPRCCSENDYCLGGNNDPNTVCDDSDDSDDSDDCLECTDEQQAEGHCTPLMGCGPLSCCGSDSLEAAPAECTSLAHLTDQQRFNADQGACFDLAYAKNGIQCCSETTPSAVDDETVTYAYRRFNGFAGSLMFLAPDTTYDYKIVVDLGDTEFAKPKSSEPNLYVTTRPEPTLPSSGAPLHTDDGSSGCRYIPPVSAAPPEVRGLSCLSPDGTRHFADRGASIVDSCGRARNTSPLAKSPSTVVGSVGRPRPAPICDGSEERPFPGFACAELCAQPGDTFLVHPGEYDGHVFKKSGSTTRAQTPSTWDGLTMIWRTTTKYIAWKGSADGLVRLRGPLVLRADHLWFEGLSLEPTATCSQVGAVNCEAIVGALGQDARSCAERCGPETAVPTVVGTRGIVITNNTFRNFKVAVGTGDYPKCSCPGSFGNAEPPATIVPIAELEPIAWGTVGGTAMPNQRQNMHRHWYVADNQIGSPHGTELVSLSFLADSDIAYNRIFGSRCDCDPTARSEQDCPDTCKYSSEMAKDAVYLPSSTNLDLYGNDIRDFRDDVVQGDGAYGNIRIWRNRAIHFKHSFVSFQPQFGAPWYLVRNEVITSGPSQGEPLKANVFDRNVIVNNTFVTNKSRYGQSGADLLLKSVSRNNLWIFIFQPDCPGDPDCKNTKYIAPGGIWQGFGDQFKGHTGRMSGQSRANWKTDVDYDGFDWDELPGKYADWPQIVTSGDATIRWLQPSDHMLSLAPTKGQHSFQDFMRGCVGGPTESDGKACCPTGEKCQCPGETPANHNGWEDPMNCAPCVEEGGECRTIEEHFCALKRNDIFEILHGEEDLDLYVDDAFSSRRLTLDCKRGIAGKCLQARGGGYLCAKSEMIVATSPEWICTCPIDAGDPNFRENRYYLEKLPVGPPDLGAYELGHKTPIYGVRPSRALVR